MNELTDKQKKILIVIIVGIIGVTGIIIYYSNIKEDNNYEEYINLEENEIIDNNKDETEEIEETKQEEKEIGEETKEIVIHIVGCVEKEGIVRLPEGSRIVDAIEKAGGEKMYADLSKINLAYVLEDGQKIRIPSIYDEEEQEYIEEGDGTVENQSNKQEEREELMINLNKATTDDLEKLPGIGTSTAEKILEYIKVNGPFENIEELKEVNGIGDAKYNRIKDYVCVK